MRIFSSRWAVIIQILALCATQPTFCFFAEAQQSAKIPRIGILPPGPISERVHLWNAFRQGLRELGYVEGKNITLVFPSTQVQLETLSHVAAELVSLKVDIIVAPTTPAALAAVNATKAIPIVMPTTIDPIVTGLVASLAHPGGNATGLTSIASDLGGKRLELLKEVVGRSDVAVLSNPTSPVVPPQIKEIKTAARELGLKLQHLEVRGPEDFERVFQSCTRQRSAHGGRCFGFYSSYTDREARDKKPAAGDLRIYGVCGRWRAYVLCREPFRDVPPCCRLRRQNSERS